MWCREKYRGSGAGAEPRSDVIAFAQLSPVFLGPKSGFEEFVRRADASQHNLMHRAYGKVQNGYQLQLYFVTTGTVSKTHREEAERIANRKQNSIQFFDRTQLFRLITDYTQGAAPPIPVLDLSVEGQLLSRYDGDTGISSWAFPIESKELAKLYAKSGVRLFDLNIRGFMGDETPVNASMRRTLKRNPERFWYFNNGVTMVCDEAEQKVQKDKAIVRARNVQIINGQQTTRVIASMPKVRHASVMLRLLAIPRGPRYEALIGEIVKATNFQTAITQADLRANDETQVRLERELRKLDYTYVRKRQSRREARVLAGGRGKHFLLSKEVLAKSVGSCVMTPDFWRQSQQRLFDDDNYRKIFDPDRPTEEYLVFFWLHKLVRRRSKEDTRRGYAVNLVLHFLWNEIGGQLKVRNARDTFVRCAEREAKYPEVVRDVSAVGDSLLDAALRFMRLQSKKGSSERDISSFFRTKGVDQQFERFWRSRANKKRTNFRTHVNRLFADLDAGSAT